MNSSSTDITSPSPTLPNGPAVAAILGAGIGCFALAVLSIAGSHFPALQRDFIFYKPTGPLSGVTTTTVLIWLFAWGLLHARWRNRNVAAGGVIGAALTLLALGLLLTFPPLAHLL